MTLIINNVDYSTYIMQEYCSETPEYINGNNASVALNGNAIFDRVGVRVSTTYKLKPMPQDMYAALFTAIKDNTVNVTYTSFLSGTTRSGQAQVSIDSVSYATTSNDNRIYYDATITIVPQASL